LFAVYFAMCTFSINTVLDTEHGFDFILHFSTNVLPALVTFNF